MVEGQGYRNILVKGLGAPDYTARLETFWQSTVFCDIIHTLLENSPGPLENWLNTEGQSMGL